MQILVLPIQQDTKILLTVKYHASTNSGLYEKKIFLVIYHQKGMYDFLFTKSNFYRQALF